jgi:hypothetical protein
MKRFLLITLATAFILAGIFLIFNLLKAQTKGKGALQITANVKSTVTLDGVSIGTTPLCKCKEDETLKEGEYLLGITPEDRNFESYTLKVKVVKEVLTAVDRTFLPGSLASASVLTLEKVDGESEEPQLLVASLPDGAIVSIDGNPEGVTPYHAKRITASEHEIEIQKKGFNKKTLRVRTVPNYKLLATVILGTESQSSDNLTPIISPTPSITGSPTTTVIPSPSQKLTPSPTISQKVTPTVALKGTVVTIKETPTGFLRVRSGPGTSFEEVARANPGDTFKYLTEQNGWYQVELADKTKGWVSGTYATKSTNPQ